MVALAGECPHADRLGIRVVEIQIGVGTGEVDVGIQSQPAQDGDGRAASGNVKDAVERAADDRDGCRALRHVQRAVDGHPVQHAAWVDGYQIVTADGGYLTLVDFAVVKVKRAGRGAKGQCTLGVGVVRRAVVHRSRQINRIIGQAHHHAAIREVAHVFVGGENAAQIDGCAGRDGDGALIRPDVTGGGRRRRVDGDV